SRAGGGGGGGGGAGGGNGEGGGLNIEHGHANIIAGNTFANNGVGVALWDDDDGALLRTPWAIANHKGSSGNRIERSTFTDESIAIRLRASGTTGITLNTFERTGKEVDTDVQSTPQPFHLIAGEFPPLRIEPLGETRPIGARAALAGRHNILMTEWGPWDHESPLLRRIEHKQPLHTYALYRIPDGDLEVRLESPGGTEAAGLTALASPPDPASPAPDGRMLEVRVATDLPGVHPYTLHVNCGNFKGQATGTLVNTLWTARFFPWTRDPRTDLPGWRTEAETAGASCELATLKLNYANDGPATLKLAATITDAHIPADRFGMIARTTLPLTPGSYRIHTLSDDGIRITARFGGLGIEERQETLLEDWTHHAPTRHSALLKIPGNPAATTRVPVELIVEHFELDGYAVLEVSIVPE
ncbi:MAG: hypothetical protein ACT4PL_01315, partial [Phycisphaerales bacterium]